MSDNYQPASKNEPEAVDEKTGSACPYCVIKNGQAGQSALPKSDLRVPTSDREGLSTLEWDTFRDILNNANDTLRFQVQLAVPLLAGCITALNVIPPQAHQELLNLLDRWVFIPVLLSMGVAFWGLELHWKAAEDKGSNNAEALSRLIKKKYHILHAAIVLQAIGLVLLMGFVVLEYK